MFMGEMLLEEGLCAEGGEAVGAQWCVERRFRVTEVFLAVVWVRINSRMAARQTGICADLLKVLCKRVPVFLFY